MESPSWDSRLKRPSTLSVLGRLLHTVSGRPRKAPEDDPPLRLDAKGSTPTRPAATHVLECHLRLIEDERKENPRGVSGKPFVYQITDDDRYGLPRSRYRATSVPLTKSLSTTGPILVMLACIGHLMCVLRVTSLIFSRGAFDVIRVSTTKSLNTGSTPSNSP